MNHYQLKNRHTDQVVEKDAENFTAAVQGLEGNPWDWLIVKTDSTDKSLKEAMVQTMFPKLEEKLDAIKSRTATVLLHNPQLAHINKKREFLRAYFLHVNGVDINFEALDDVESILRMRRKLVDQEGLDRGKLLTDVQEEGNRKYYGQ